MPSSIYSCAHPHLLHAGRPARALAGQLAPAARNPRWCSGCRPAARRFRSIASWCLHAAGARRFPRATTFNLDEFLGVGADDPRSYRAFMERHLFDHVNLSPRRIHFLNGAVGAGQAVSANASATSARSARRRHRSADPRARHQRAHRLQRAGAGARRAHAPHAPEAGDAAGQRGAVRQPRRARCRARRCRWGWRRFFTRGGSCCSRPAPRRRAAWSG